MQSIFLMILDDRIISLLYLKIKYFNLFLNFQKNAVVHFVYYYMNILIDKYVKTQKFKKHLFSIKYESLAHA